MIKIPKIIHQTWKTDELPFPFDELSKTWKELHPDWQYILWTDEMNRDLIKNYYPDFLEKYDNYSYNIQKVDAFRYFVLKKYGGVYVDLDFECFKNIETLLDGHECVFGKEPDYHAFRMSRDFIICNALMASIPENDFLDFVCDKVAEYPTIEVTDPVDVLKSTGPFLLTDAYKEYRMKDDVTILESKDLYPINYFETELVLLDKIPPKLQTKIDNAYAVHYFLGNWS